jgi:hypothetical protein
MTEKQIQEIMALVDRYARASFNVMEPDGPSKMLDARAAIESALCEQVPQPAQPVAWFDNSGAIQGRVSDEQLEALCRDALATLVRRQDAQPAQAEQPSSCKLTECQGLPPCQRCIATGMQKAERAPRNIADPFTYIIQHLNSTPYNLTKDECIQKVRELRDLYTKD